MTPSRISKPRPSMPRLSTSNCCDICGKVRATGNHSACSKKRQALFRQQAVNQ